MKVWFKRNWLAFIVIAVTIAVIGVTVSIPKAKDHPVAGQAAVKVPARDSYEMGGVTMRLTSIQMPALKPAAAGATGGRLVAYLLTREHDGAPAGPPDGTLDCEATFSDGRRQWQQSASYDVASWAEGQGYTTDCWDTGPLLFAMTVPDGARITLVGVGFRKDVDVAPDEAMPDQSKLWTVVEFETG